jgi:methionine synthase II (cobalamin-independent)
MPRVSFLENMYVQFSEKMPGLLVDQAGKAIRLDTSKAFGEIEEVYAKYLENDLEFFRISEDHAKGFYRFLSLAKDLPKGVKFLKGHITGPISYALSLIDQNKRSVLYDKDLFEVLTKVLVMKARWQIKKLKELFPGVIIFIDEPSLVSLGSSYVNINADTAFERLDELIKAIKDEGAICALHCCGNTDWPVLLKRDIDIISFDAYNFTKEFLLYGAEREEFFLKGGTVAWGVVPTSDAIEKETPEGLAQKLFPATGSALVTPSCGVGTLDERLARKVFETTRSISEIIRKR